MLVCIENQFWGYFLSNLINYHYNWSAHRRACIYKLGLQNILELDDIVDLNSNFLELIFLKRVYVDYFLTYNINF